MRNKFLFWQIKISNQIYFWPLIIMAGKLVQRVVFNVWNIFESGGPFHSSGGGGPF